MKRILIGFLIGIFLSILLFILVWKDIEKSIIIPQQLSHQKYCDEQKINQEICQECNRKYECIKNECDKKTVIKEKCQEIEKYWEELPLEITPESFVSSFCGVNNDYYNGNCLKEPDRNFKLQINLTLSRIPIIIGISAILSLIGIYDQGLFGIIILLTPPILGLFIGWASLVIKEKKVN